jgi:hypothetical protein
MDKKKLIICGDSFMSPTIKLPGTHFSELVSEKMGLELVCFSRSSMSNGGIISQLQKAITLNPEIIIFNTTFADRIELSLTEKNLEDLEIDLTCEDFYYGERKDYSCKTINDNDYTMGSESIESLLNGGIFPEKKSAVDNFLSNIYNRKWKIQMDRHAIYSMAHQIYTKGIPFLFMIDIIDAASKMSWLPKNQIGFSWKELESITLDKFDIKFEDPGYHTTPEVQMIIADDTIEKIKSILGYSFHKKII